MSMECVRLQVNCGAAIDRMQREIMAKDAELERQRVLIERCLDVLEDRLEQRMPAVHTRVLTAAWL